MLRALFVGVFASFLAIAGCAVDTAAPDQGESIEQTGEAAGGKSCTSSAGCNAHQYCTTEDGDCFSACRPGQPCIAVCTGVCKRQTAQAGEACGSTICPSGQVCCNASCGICTEPGGVCIQLACVDEEI
jgi:hypothetical protein